MTGDECDSVKETTRIVKQAETPKPLQDTYCDVCFLP